MKRMIPAAACSRGALAVACVLAALAAGCGTVKQAIQNGSAAVAAEHTKFRVQEVVDQKQGGLVGLRYAVPQDWNAGGKFDWNYSRIYLPLRVSTRSEAPDGSAWLETDPTELFVWLDPRWDRGPTGISPTGSIHQKNIRLVEAMQRYVLARYRGNVQGLQLVGIRRVDDLPQALGQAPAKGTGVCMRVRYQQNGDTVDEEFYGFMSDVLTIPYHGPQGTTYEYHRMLSLIHSMGAKNGKLDSMRPTLGRIATSYQVDKVWQQQYQIVIKQLNEQFQRNLAAGYAQIEAAGRLSRQLSAQSDAMIQAMDQQRAESNQASAHTDDRAYEAAENFDQYIRGTEKVEDSFGQVTEQPSQYNYHWADGYGNFVHTNDADFDPNRYSTGAAYQRMTPAQ